MCYQNDIIFDAMASVISKIVSAPERLNNLDSTKSDSRTEGKC